MLSYCVVNTNGREDLMACLAAIERVHPGSVEHEVLVLDNASQDGSADAVRARDRKVRLIERPVRSGKALNDSILLQEARGEWCMLLNEDTELLPGAPEALLGALEADREAAAAGAQLLRPDGRPQPCAWRLPGIGTALASALFVHRLVVTQSRGSTPRRVGWVQSSAMLVRRSAAEDVGFLDPEFFLYSDETDFCKRLGDTGWAVLYVPGARAIHHEQLATDRSAGARRVVEFHRNRDLYMRKHHSRIVAAAARALSAWSYLPRALAAVALPGHDLRWYLLHARQALCPGRGLGLREGAEEHNRRLGIPAESDAATQPPPRSSSRASAS